MAMIPFSSVFLFFSLVLSTFSLTHASYSSCFKKNIASIPHDHLLYTKPKPLVIGHRGNPMMYQENTLEGFKSLLDTNADGFEMDIYLTKDDQLVAFHDGNTQYLTGVSKTVWEMTADELTKLTIKDSLTFGSNIYKFSGRPHIPLVRDVLVEMKDSGKIMFLEIKSNHAISFEASSKAGRLVAKMVTDLGLVNQASITSFDPIIVRAAHQQNPSIPTGMLYTRAYWDTKCKTLKDAIQMLPEMKKCPMINITDCKSFMKEVFESGDVLKAVNVSFLDMDYKIYDNPLYSTNTFHALRKSYSHSISAGAWTMYSMALKRDSPEALKQDSEIYRLMKIGVERFITDDVYHLLSALRRHVNRPVVFKSTVGPESTTLTNPTSTVDSESTTNAMSTERPEITTDPVSTEHPESTTNSTSTEPPENITNQATISHTTSSAVREIPCTLCYMTVFLFLSFYF